MPWRRIWAAIQTHGELFELVSDAYASWSHPDTAPLTPIGPGLYLLELFHGPTLAFKDFAMQVLSRLMERALKRRGARTTILGATSGDTGAAAVEAFRGRPGHRAVHSVPARPHQR